MVSWSVASLPEGRSVFSVAVCKYRLVNTYHASLLISSCTYVESLPLVLKDTRSCYSQGERFAVQLPLDRALALRK